MNLKRFNELLNGPLAHPAMMFRLTRLTIALLAVVEATGEEGERALEEHCRNREEQDAQNAEEP